MNQCHLKLYYGPTVDEGDTTSSGSASNTNQITLPVGDILPLLADAVESQRTWLRDFKNDPITITSDLYEVLLAYQHFRRPSA